MAAALPDIANTAGASPAMRERGIQLIKQGAQQPKPDCRFQIVDTEFQIVRGQRVKFVVILQEITTRL